MRIGLDVRAAFGKSSGRRGIGRYTDSLARALARNNVDHELFYYSFRNNRQPVGYVGRFRSVSKFDRPRLNWMIDALLLPARIRRDTLRIFHAMDVASIPRQAGCQVWATVHDMIPFVFWEQTVKVTPLDFRFALKWALRRLRRVDRIITCSRHSRRDICRILDVPDSRVHVVFPGRTEGLEPLEREFSRSVLAGHGIDTPFLFYLGGSDFRKNLLGLLEAFSRTCQLGYGGKLVVGGETFLWAIPEVEAIHRRVRELSLDQRVLFSGYIEDQALSLFYSACDCFVFPSYYEGFGLPVLEAMQCGAPVLCARSSSLPEVAGDAAVYFDPSSVEEMAEVFARVCADEKQLTRMRQAGVEQAALFDWDETARQILSLYEEHEHNGRADGRY